MQIRKETGKTDRTGRMEVLSLMAELLLAIYGDRLKIPDIVARYAIHNPLKAIGLIVQRREMPASNRAVAAIMKEINPVDFDFRRPANLQEQSEFQLRLYRS